MSFENSKFEAGVASTIKSMQKLNESLKLSGATKGLRDVEAASGNVRFSGLRSMLDTLKTKLGFPGSAKGFTDIEAASGTVRFAGLRAGLETLKEKLGFAGSSKGFTDIEAASGNVRFAGLRSMLETVKTKLGFPGSSKGFTDIESASGNVRFSGLRAGLETVKEKLRLTGATKGFENVQQAERNVKFTSIGQAADGVGSRISAMSVVAVTALGTIVHKAVAAGSQMAKALTINPISTGLKEYETNLNSIQTILANTKASGATLGDVNRALKELNAYSDKTIYNFSEMAKNIGTFTAAGVDLKTSTESIKGIANLAAMSGSNSQQASTAMYQLSQAIASGRVSLQDWNSVVNAGMGGSTFQRALATTAESMGTLDKGSVKLTGSMKNVSISGQSFRESISAGPGKDSWLTSEVLTNTLKQFTGDLKDSELAAMGFNAAQIKSIQATAKTAMLAATEVKTLSGVFDVAKETAGSGWAATFEILFGDFKEAKTLFTGLSQTISGFIADSANARNKVLGDWKELGGRTLAIESIKNVFQALSSVVKPIKEAFREIFPAKTGKDLYDLTAKFERFTEKLKIGPATAENLKRTFAGFFAVVHIGTTIIGKIIGMFGKLLGASSSGAGGILNFTGGIGDFLVALDKAITGGKGLSNFFDGIGAILALPLKLLGGVAEAIGGLFGGFDAGKAGGVGSSVKGLSGALRPLRGALDAAKGAWSGFVESFKKAASFLKPVIDEIGDLFGNLGDVIGDAIAKSDFSQVFQILQTTLIGGIFLAIRKALGGGLKLDFGGGALDGLKTVFSTLNKSLVQLQTSVKAGTLLKIAISIAALAVAVKVMASINPGDLAKALTGIGVGLGQLLGVMALLGKIGGSTGFLTLPFLSASMILLSVAVNALALAVFAFSRLSWNELAKGLAGVGGSLVAVAAGVKLIPPSIVLVGPALIPLAIALNLIAVAVRMFGSMDLLDLAKGLAAIGLSLKAISISMKLMPPTMLLTAAGLVAVGAALNLIAMSVLAFGSLSLMSIGKGLLGIGGSLTAIGLALKLFPPSLALQAAGLVLVGIALTGIAGALGLMGKMSIQTIVKGLAAIGASLVVLGYGLKFMSGTFLGSAALLAAATALAILVPVIGILGTMRWSTIFKGLAAIGGALIVIGAAGTIAAPGLTALGIAMIPLGIGVVAVGAGVYLLAKALVLLGSGGAKGIAVLIASLTAMVAILPKIVIDFIKGLVQIGVAIVDLAPQIVAAMVKILTLLLDVVIKTAPKMAQAFLALIMAGIRVILIALPALLSAGFSMLNALLRGIADNIGMVTTRVGEIIVRFLTALGSQLPRLIPAGLSVLVKLLEGVANGMPRVVAAGATLIAKFLNGVANNIGKVVSAAANLIVKFVNSIAGNLGDVISAGANVIVKFLKGIGNNIGKVTRAAADMIGDFIEAAADAMIRLANRIAKIVVNFLNGLASAIRTNGPELRKAGGNLIDAIVDGGLAAISATGGKIISGIVGIFKGAIRAAKRAIRGKSPSRVFMQIGKDMIDGTVIGIDGQASAAYRSVDSATNGMIDAMVKRLSVVPDAIDGLIDLDPVITPVLDLTNAEVGAKQLADLTNVTPITTAASYDQAAAISAAQEASQTSTDDDSDPKSLVGVKFEQNNYSPESLSATEVYRQTKNQLAQAKDVIGLVS